MRRSVCSIALLLVCLDWKSDSFSYRAHLPLRFQSPRVHLSFAWVKRKYGISVPAGSIRLRAWGENAESLIDPLIEVLQSLPIGQPPEVKRTKAIGAHAASQSSASVTVRLVSALPVAQPTDIVRQDGSKQVDRPAQKTLQDLIFTRGRSGNRSVAVRSYDREFETRGRKYGYDCLRLLCRQCRQNAYCMRINP